jgi:deoxycytidylate deaminase
MLSKSLLRLTQKSRHFQFHHAVHVKRGGAVVSSGYNLETRHAEVAALEKLWPSERVGTTVVSIRVTKSGLLSSAKPCKNCMKYLLENGVKKLIYSDFDGKLVTEKL